MCSIKFIFDDGSCQIEKRRILKEVWYCLEYENFLPFGTIYSTILQKLPNNEYKIITELDMR